MLIRGEVWRQSTAHLCRLFGGHRRRDHPIDATLSKPRLAVTPVWTRSMTRAARQTAATTETASSVATPPARPTAEQQSPASPSSQRLTACRPSPARQARARRSTKGACQILLVFSSSQNPPEEDEATSTFGSQHLLRRWRRRVSPRKRIQAQHRSP